MTTPSNPITAVVEQTHELTSWLPGADPATAVPTCPAWVLRDLVEHVGATQRWVTRLLTDRVSDPMAAFGISWDTIPAATDAWRPWLTEGVDALVDAFDAPSPGEAVFDPSFTGDGLAFWARRLFGEITVHRIDAAVTLGRDYVLAPELAGFAVDDWFGTITSAGWAANVPGFADAMRGSGQTVTWVARDIDRAWVVERSDAPLVLTTTSAHEDFATGDGAAVVEGDALDALYLVSRRRPIAQAASVRGDRAELDLLVDHTNWVGGG